MPPTSTATARADPFGGPLVVSMRPLAGAHVARAADITGCFPDMHGRPVHAGDPAALGIAEPGRPDYRDPVAIEPGEVPVYEPSGAGGRADPVLHRARSGSMLITGLRA